MKNRVLRGGAVAALLLSMSLSAHAADYNFGGAKSADYYPSTDYAVLYGSAYNYGGTNAIDYATSSLPYGVDSNVSIGAMEPVRILDSGGTANVTPLTGGAVGVSTDGKTVHIEGVGTIYSPSGAITVTKAPATAASVTPAAQKTAFTSSSGMKRSDGSIGTVKISVLGIDMKVWDGETYASMKKGLWHYADSSAWDGNVCVCGYNRGATYTIGNIKNLEIGDKITYTTVKGTRTYAVDFVKIIANNDWTDLGQTSDNRITLTTCLADHPESRVIVQAKEVK